MTNNKQRGFTIIEVALVLAVAALIFLVVFLAVPALQRNQRDDARKRDVANVVQAVTNAVANANSGLVTGLAWKDGVKGTLTAGTTDKALLQDYLDPMSTNVDYVYIATNGTSALTFSTTQDITSVASTSTIPGVNMIVVYTGASCDGNVKTKPASKRTAAVVIQVENGGKGKYFCTTAN
jgi:prepilin-type N-terminal cleavage/methylation domain-containing protein